MNGHEDENDASECATCNGWVWVDSLSRFIRHRETVGMVCPTCGTDYSVIPPGSTTATEDPLPDG
jgi:DnaJ-class molecular chaperone